MAVLATQMERPQRRAFGGHHDRHGNCICAQEHRGASHDVAMTGEITIMGKVLAVGGIQAKLLAAIEAGVKTVILPAENEQDGAICRTTCLGS